MGQITQKGNKALYRVRSIKDLKVIINHFDKYPLLTQKQADFELFKSIIQLMESKEHLTEKGLYKILSIKGSINKGLSEGLKAYFPNITPVIRPLIVDTKIKDPQ